MFIRRAVNKVNYLSQQYQTRKQLQALPDYLLKDIAMTPFEAKQEAHKASFLHTFMQLIKRA